MNLILVLPVVIPLTTGIVGLLLLRRSGIQRWLNQVSSLVQLLVAFVLLEMVWSRGILSVQLGNWPAPFGITFVADLLSALMVLITGFVAFFIALYSLSQNDNRTIGFGFYPLVQFLLAGVSGAFLTGDFFNLFVWFEVMLMASFVLIVLGGGKKQIEGGFKYVTINIVASVLFLAGLGILYGQVGSLNMADVSLKLMKEDNAAVALTAGMLLMISFGIKAGAFPLFFWLPASYHTPQPVVTALFAGLLTKVGVYALLRSFTLVFTQNVSFTHSILLVVSVLTMVSGVLGAASQFHIRKILSFHTISQIGYMLLGLALFTTAAISAAIFYMFHHFLVKTNLFLVSGIVKSYKGTEELKEIGSLYKTSPWLALFFLISAFSLVGIPPLSGFFAKFAIVKASLDINQFLIAGIAAAVGVLTLYSMTKIWAEAFWKKDPAGNETNEKPTLTGTRAMFVPVILLAVLTVGVGMFPSYLFRITDGAANQLLNPEIYIKTVLGEGYVHSFQNR